jgi:hypothetical protein
MSCRILLNPSTVARNFEIEAHRFGNSCTRFAGTLVNMTSFVEREYVTPVFVHLLRHDRLSRGVAGTSTRLHVGRSGILIRGHWQG